MTAAVLLLKVTVVLTLALAGTRLARHSRAAVRHVLLAASFGVLLILPIASLVAPTVQIAMPAAMQEAIGPLDSEPVIEAPATAARSTDETAVAPQRSSWLSFTTAVTAVWLAGIIVFLAPVAGGLWQVRRLRRSALPCREGRASLQAIARDPRIRRRVDVLQHESLAGPMTCGVLRPAIVLPGDATTWAEPDLRRAIVHELEHIRRGDRVSQILARIVAAVYWFHPIVWVAWRQLALEAERACDDAVLLSAPLKPGASPDSTEYADQLVALARRLSTTSNQPHLAMANRSDLATRVVAVLDSRQRRGRAGAQWLALACVVSAMLIAMMSPLRLVASVEITQTPASSGTRQKYDAASIKRCEAEENPTGARGTAGGTNATFSPGRFFVPCVTTQQLIYLAYASTGAAESDRLINDDPGSGSNPTKVRGGPAWVHSLRDKYSIEATAAGATERTVLMGSMLRSLLEDRFKLKLHRETEEVPMFALTVAKSGLKLKPMKEGDCDPDAPMTTTPTDAKPRCGVLQMLGVEGGTKIRWTFAGFQLRSLAARLSSQFKVHVIDRTNNTDQFVFQFEFPRDPDPLVTESAIFAGIEEQLGLKLEKTKGPRGFLVIDSIERPTPDLPIMEEPSRARGAGR